MSIGFEKFVIRNLALLLLTFSQKNNHDYSRLFFRFCILFGCFYAGVTVSLLFSHLKVYVPAVFTTKLVPDACA